MFVNTRDQSPFQEQVCDSSDCDKWNFTLHWKHNPQGTVFLNPEMKLPS